MGETLASSNYLLITKQFARPNRAAVDLTSIVVTGLRSLNTYDVTSPRQGFEAA